MNEEAWALLGICAGAIAILLVGRHLMRRYQRGRRSRRLQRRFADRLAKRS